jgi:glycosidase
MSTSTTPKFNFTKPHTMTPKHLFTYLLLAGCVFWSKAQTALHGLYTPVQLQAGETTIYLRDYLVDEKAISLELPEGLYQLNSGTDTLVVGGKMQQKMDVLTLNLGTERRHLVLINPSARAVNITVSAQKLFGKEVRIIGAFNNWNRGSAILNPGKGVYSATYTLEPGTYEYKFFLDGKEVLDPSNPDSVSNGMGSYNNVLTVAPLDTVQATDYTLTHSSVTFRDEQDPAGREVKMQPIFQLKNQAATNRYIVLWNNQQLTFPCDRSMRPTCNIVLPKAASGLKRSYLRVYAFAGSDKGRDQLIPLEYGVPVTDVKQLDRTDWHLARMYFLMVDRFYNGDKNNDLPTPDSTIQPIANYMGGDLAGVEQKINQHFFTNLGTNTIWLSPITQNPYDAWGNWNKGNVHSTFSGYHGYWPISNTQVDTRFGTSTLVDSLLQDAHQQSQNVVLDYVANHVHINHPIYQQHKNWATDLYLPDGTKNTEKWDEHRLTTWFDDHLPTLDLRRYEVVDPMADSALFWLERYDFDGFRHDATKHIDELYWRTLSYRVKRNTTKPIYQIGETYGSPQLINSYISTGMLDAQFDFNLYDATVAAFAFENGDLSNLVNKLQQGLDTYGYHHLMGNITGNQDRVRFISLASGDVNPADDPKLVGWDTEIGKPKVEAYLRLGLVHAFNNAIPGIPCIYYGDEYGLPGAGDPDNRRMMKFEGYDAEETALLEKVKKLNHLRATNLALLYGSTEVIQLPNGLLKITRSYLNETVIVYLNPTKTSLYTPPLTKGERLLVSFKSAYSTAKNTKGFEIAPLSFEYLIKQ